MGKVVDKFEVAWPGFINVFLKTYHGVDKIGKILETDAIKPISLKMWEVESANLYSSTAAYL